MLPARYDDDDIYGGTRNAMVMVGGNGLGNRSSNLGRGSLYFTYF